jgi:hypothetical protein
MPEVQGLLVLGEEYSTITFSPFAGAWPKEWIAVCILNKFQPESIGNRKVQKSFDHIKTCKSSGFSATI